MRMRYVTIVAAVLALPVGFFARAESSGHDIELTLPPEILINSERRTQPCNQCCIDQNMYYSEGAIIKRAGILLQCQHDRERLSTHPLIWRRVNQ